MMQRFTTIPKNGKKKIGNPSAVFYFSLFPIFKFKVPHTSMYSELAARISFNLWDQSGYFACQAHSNDQNKTQVLLHVTRSRSQSPNLRPLTHIFSPQVVKVWDLETGRSVFEFSQAHGDQAVTCMSFDSTERRLANTFWQTTSTHRGKVLNRFYTSFSSCNRNLLLCKPCPCITGRVLVSLIHPANEHLNVKSALSWVLIKAV